MQELICFTALEFTEDPNVAGLKYWYLCPFDNVAEGDKAVAPLGRHNRLQTGTVREVRYSPDYEAPFPLHLIKRVVKIIKSC